MGAIAIPALLDKNFEAVTFLLLAPNSLEK
ncbi:YIEGIA domain-containing protein [Clostridium sp.]|nr:YIEGIA domain-containing protein [Clostridium sp.]